LGWSTLVKVSSEPLKVTSTCKCSTTVNVSHINCVQQTLYTLFCIKMVEIFRSFLGMMSFNRRWKQMVMGRKVVPGKVTFKNNTKLCAEEFVSGMRFKRKEIKIKVKFFC